MWNWKQKMFAGRNNDNGFWPCTGLKSKPLVIPELKAHNQFTVDSLQGSVPSSPSDETGDYPPTALDMDTREIIDTFLKNFTGLPHSKSGRKQVLSTMRRVVDSLAVKHEFAYKGSLSFMMFSGWLVRVKHYLNGQPHPLYTHLAWQVATLIATYCYLWFTGLFQVWLHGWIWSRKEKMWVSSSKWQQSSSAMAPQTGVVLPVCWHLGQWCASTRMTED